MLTLSIRVSFLFRCLRKPTQGGAPGALPELTPPSLGLAGGFSSHSGDSNFGIMAHHRDNDRSVPNPYPPPYRAPHGFYWPAFYPSLSSSSSSGVISRAPLLAYPVPPAPFITYPMHLYPPSHARQLSLSSYAHYQHMVTERHHRQQAATSSTTGSHLSSMLHHCAEQDGHTKHSHHRGSHARTLDPPQRPTVHVNRSLTSPTGGSRYPTVSLLCYNLLAQDLLEKNMHLYDNCPEESLKWESRGERLVRELLSSRADVS